MKDSMIDIMVSMMPLMKPFMWAGAAIAVLGMLLLLLQVLFKSNTGTGVKWSTRLVFFVALFFIAAQVAGYFLSMPPAINFGDSSKMEFILVSFWQISLTFFVIASVLKIAGNFKTTQTS